MSIGDLVKLASLTVVCSSSLLLYVPRDHKDYLGRVFVFCVYLFLYWEIKLVGAVGPVNHTL